MVQERGSLAGQPIIEIIVWENSHARVVTVSIIFVGKRMRKHEINLATLSVEKNRA